jgi:hypothetical protein
MYNRTTSPEPKTSSWVYLLRLDLAVNSMCDASTSTFLRSYTHAFGRLRALFDLSFSTPESSPNGYKTYLVRIENSSHYLVKLIVRKSWQGSTKGWNWRRWANSDWLRHIVVHEWLVSLLSLLAWGWRTIIIPTFTLLSSRLLLLIVTIVTTTTVAASITKPTTSTTTSADCCIFVRTKS